jgi:hypothetical protein
MAVNRNNALKGVVFSIFLACAALGNEMPIGFSTRGHTIYHLRCAQMHSHGGTVLIGAAFDGTVVAYTTTGQLSMTVKNH